jgi:CheY-like chemotaxis protein
MTEAEPKRPRILLVDDSVLVQRMVREYFEPAGYDVVTAGNGQEAMEAVREQVPQVIISDIIMPVMDGWEFCEAIRSDPKTGGIPFLFLTAVREVPKRIQGLRMGADDYITKPFSREELMARVEVCLAKMERIRRGGDGKSDAALAGDTAHLPVPDLLQLLSLNGKTGELKLFGEHDQNGKVFFRKGQVVQAQVGTVTGIKALFRILDLPEGRFALDPEAELPDSAPIKESTSNVLMEGYAHNDELRELGSRLPDRQARLRIVGSLANHQDALGVQEKAVVTEFAGKASLSEVMDRSPLSDLEIGRAVAALMERKLLQPVEE